MKACTPILRNLSLLHVSSKRRAVDEEEKVGTPIDGKNTTVVNSMRARRRTWSDVIFPACLDIHKSGDVDF